jgi:hypothetical protein
METNDLLFDKEYLPHRRIGLDSLTLLNCFRGMLYLAPSAGAGARAESDARQIPLLASGIIPM